MPENFQQTVNLKEKMKKGDVRPAPAKTAERVSQAGNTGREDAAKEALEKINRLQPSEFNGKALKAIVLIAALAMIAFAVKWQFFRDDKAFNAEKWYSVKLSNGEMFFGQVADTSADPLVIRNVYYDYDQLQAENGKTEAAPDGSLRLVKRGKETHGPEGSLDIVRSQVLYMEPLKEDSKILKAIVEYEK